MRLRNVTVSSNIANSPEAGVGGISQNGFAFLNNVTITLNHGRGDFAGSFRGGGIQTTAGELTVLTNSVIAGNNGGGGPADCVGDVTSDSRYNLIGVTTACGLPAVRRRGSSASTPGSVRSRATARPSRPSAAVDEPARQRRRAVHARRACGRRVRGARPARRGAPPLRHRRPRARGAGAGDDHRRRRPSTSPTRCPETASVRRAAAPAPCGPRSRRPTACPARRTWRCRRVPTCLARRLRGRPERRTPRATSTCATSSRSRAPARRRASSTATP